MKTFPPEDYLNDYLEKVYKVYLDCERKDPILYKNDGIFISLEIYLNREEVLELIFNKVKFKPILKDNISTRNNQNLEQYKLELEEKNFNTAIVERQKQNDSRRKNRTITKFNY